MKTILLILGGAIITALSASGQINYSYSDNFSATCNETDNLDLAQTYIYLHNDSIIIEDVINNQCCPEFALKISEVINDSLFITFSDTTSMMCDCMCDYDVRINAGKLPMENLIVVYNGKAFLVNSYDSIVVESKIWSNLSGGYGVEMVVCCYSTTFLKIETDPLINTPDEKQLLASTDSLKTWEKIAYIKESDKKIYFRDLDNHQGLLYDFEASIGDTINIVNYSQNFDPDTIVVQVKDIDSVNYLGVQRQRFEIQDIHGNHKDYWITGIGSMNGLLNPCIEITGGFRELLCVHNHEMLIYMNSERMTCYMDDDNLTAADDYDIEEIEVFPNPSSGLIHIDYNGEKNDLTYSIISPAGQLIFYGKLNDRTINVNLETGFYILRINDKDKLIFEEKLLITK
jgi:hypothetical protein